MKAPSRITRILIAAAATVLLTGCRLTASYEFRIHPNGLVDVAVSLLADRELLATASTSGEVDMKKAAEELASELNKRLAGTGIRAEPVALEDRAGARIEAKNLPAAQAQKVLNEAWGAMFAAGSQRSNPRKPAETPGKVSLSVAMSQGLWNSSGEFRLELPPAGAQLAGILSTEVRVTVPGEVLKTNGTTLGRNAVKWSGPLPTGLSAWATYTAPNWPGRIGIAAAVLAAASVLVLVFRRSRPRRRHCPACGASIPAGARFCTSCGATVG
jgi:hypothetical protein